MTIKFAFDYLSPYAYLAWTQIHTLAARNGHAVEPMPILFAALLGKYGHKGPAEIPPKRAYVFKDVTRSAHVLGVKLLPPPTHPFNPLLALRVSSIPVDAEKRRALIDNLFAETWGGGRGVTDPQVVAECAAKAGLDGPALVAEASSDAIKARLKAQTDEALERGAFGIPTMFAGDELFWGLDSLPHLERFIQGRDPLPPEILEQWNHIVPSATRS